MYIGKHAVDLFSLRLELVSFNQVLLYTNCTLEIIILVLSA